MSFQQEINRLSSSAMSKVMPIKDREGMQGMLRRDDIGSHRKRNVGEVFDANGRRRDVFDRNCVAAWQGKRTNREAREVEIEPRKQKVLVIDLDAEPPQEPQRRKIDLVGPVKTEPVRKEEEREKSGDINEENRNKREAEKGKMNMKQEKPDTSSPSQAQKTKAETSGRDAKDIDRDTSSSSQAQKRRKEEVRETHTKTEEKETSSPSQAQKRRKEEVRERHKLTKTEEKETSSPSQIQKTRKEEVKRGEMKTEQRDASSSSQMQKRRKEEVKKETYEEGRTGEALEKRREDKKESQKEDSLQSQCFEQSPTRRKDDTSREANKAEKRKEMSPESQRLQAAQERRKARLYKVIKLLDLERTNFKKDKPFGFFARFADREDGLGQNPFQWICGIPGWRMGPWKGTVFTMTIDFTEDFPETPPKCTFALIDGRPLFHPNVDPSGVLRMRILNKDEDWKPTITIRDMLLGIQDVLDKPDMNLSVQEEPHQLYSNDPKEYHRRVNRQVAEKIFFEKHLEKIYRSW